MRDKGTRLKQEDKNKERIYDGKDRMKQSGRREKTVQKGKKGHLIKLITGFECLLAGVCASVFGLDLGFGVANRIRFRLILKLMLGLLA